MILPYGVSFAALDGTIAKVGFLSILCADHQRVEHAMANFCIPGPFSGVADNYRFDIDEGTLCRTRSPAPGIVGHQAHETVYSYSISGKTGALGQMLFTAAMRIPGTWYDHTTASTALRAKEAALGMSGFVDKKYRESAKITLQNIKSPYKADVDIHFETKDRVENITVRGRHGMRSFRFDFNKLEARAEKAPKDADIKGTDVMKPLMDTIDEILAAVIQLR